jgi:hypothetical protein
MSEPTENQPNGARLQTAIERNPNGKFAKGNRGGPGNPDAPLVAKHRAAFFAAIKSSDAKNALRTIRQVMNDPDARSADRLAAAVQLLDRVVGRAVQSDVLARIEALEKLLIEKEGEQ